MSCNGVGCVYWLWKEKRASILIELGLHLKLAKVCMGNYILKFIFLMKVFFSREQIIGYFYNGA